MAPDLCAVPTCLAARAPRSAYCALHQTAAVASTVGASGRCLRCNRAIGSDDYVGRAPVAHLSRLTKVTTWRWQHAACDPAPRRLSKRARRESVKPLFDDLGGA